MELFENFQQLIKKELTILQNKFEIQETQLKEREQNINTKMTEIKQKEALKTNIADTQAALNAKGPKGAENDYKNWVEAVKQNGYRAVGQNAVDNQGNIVATYDVSDKEKDEANMRMKNAAGSMVSTGSGIVGATIDMISGSTANIRDAEDRADEYRNQKSITQSYLL